jgi:hypothetical protein
MPERCGHNHDLPEGHPDGPPAFYEFPVKRRSRMWSRQALRYFRWEIGFMLFQIGYITVMSLATPFFDLELIILGLSFVGVMLVLIWRVAAAHRLGFNMGLMGGQLARALPRQRDAIELIERTQEIWDPGPFTMAQTMAIEKTVEAAEKHANGGGGD